MARRKIQGGSEITAWSDFRGKFRVRNAAWIELHRMPSLVRTTDLGTGLFLVANRAAPERLVCEYCGTRFLGERAKYGAYPIEASMVLNSRCHE